ncbi:MAG: T9SS type A sorting domain-containing protein [Bacteroidetes bacterium]|nr:T9SS type A sorting domain-containing protein [Bacteroidota bacterium]
MSSGSGKYGVDIAALNGTLSAVSGSGLTLMSGELVQSAGITYVSPKVIQFNYTAPGSAGSDSLYATVDRGHSGAWYWAPNKGFKIYTVSGIVNNETPVNYYLSQNFPNPFNPVTKITYGVMKASNVKVTVYDMLGKQVASLVNEYQNAGNYYVNFDASKYSSGIYYYKIEAGDFREVKKMSLIK